MVSVILVFIVLVRLIIVVIITRRLSGHGGRTRGWRGCHAHELFIQLALGSALLSSRCFHTRLLQVGRI